MKLKHILFSGIFFWVIFLLVYFILERLNMVPLIALYKLKNQDYFLSQMEGFNPTPGEEILLFFFTFFVTWIGSQLLYVKIFLKEKIE